MFGFGKKRRGRTKSRGRFRLKPLFGRSGYSYTTASALQKPVKTTKEIFADGVEFGRGLEKIARGSL